MTRGVKTKLTDKQWKKMGEFALNGCQDGTIAGLMDISSDTIHSNEGIQRFLHKKRCERKNVLRSAQTLLLGQTAMAIFLGKNELGQADKQDHEHTGKDGKPIAVQIVDYANIDVDDNTKQTI